MVFTIFWGTPAQQGSLANMRELVRRHQVDKGVKVFNTGDEFLVHAFKAHLVASTCSLLKVTSVSDSVSHENSIQWLQSKAEQLVADTLMPIPSTCGQQYRPAASFLALSKHLQFGIRKKLSATIKQMSP